MNNVTHRCYRSHKNAFFSSTAIFENIAVFEKRKKRRRRKSKKIINECHTGVTNLTRMLSSQVTILETCTSEKAFNVGYLSKRR